MALNRILMSSALAISLGYAVGSHAQTSSPPPAGSAGKPATEAPAGSTDAAARVEQANEMRAERLIGTTVRNSQDESIGKISDLILDEKGATTDAVISVGGFLGIGDKHVAIPWNELKVQDGGRKIVLEMSKDQLKAAPAFRTREAADADSRADTERSRAREQTTPRPNQGGGTPVR